MEDLAKATQTLMGFGMSAEESQVRLKQLGDISQGDAGKFESLTLAFAQMSSTGKLTGQGRADDERWSIPGFWVMVRYSVTSGLVVEPGL